MKALRGGKRIPLKANVDLALTTPGTRVREARAGRAPHWRRACRCTPAAISWFEEAVGEPAEGMRAGSHGRGGSAVHPLHLGLHRQAQGRAAHERRLSRLRVDDARAGVRRARGRHLLVHGRRRLGHRSQLRRVRPARERRDHGDVRRRAELSRRGPLLADRRQAQGHDLLHGADRDSRADARRRSSR